MLNMDPETDNAAQLSAFKLEVSFLMREVNKCKICGIYGYIRISIYGKCSKILNTRCRECSGSVVECLTRNRGAVGFEPHWGHCVVVLGVTALWSLSKTHLSQLSTGSTQEDPSLFNLKIVDGT